MPKALKSLALPLALVAGLVLGVAVLPLVTADGPKQAEPTAAGRWIDEECHYYGGRQRSYCLPLPEGAAQASPTPGATTAAVAPTTTPVSPFDRIIEPTRTPTPWPTPTLVPEQIADLVPPVRIGKVDARGRGTTVLEAQNLLEGEYYQDALTENRRRAAAVCAARTDGFTQLPEDYAYNPKKSAAPSRNGAHIQISFNQIRCVRP